MFLTTTSPTQTYTLSLHDALPIYRAASVPLACFREVKQDRRGVDGHPFAKQTGADVLQLRVGTFGGCRDRLQRLRADRKSTRLNSSHITISYAVFCLKKKKKSQTT